MIKKTTLIALIAIPVTLAVIGCAALNTATSDTPTPQYQVISTDDNIEIRDYAPMIIAEVSVQGPRDVAIQDGFKILANYIFGDNRSQSDIAMTAPVQQQPVNGANGAWSVSFVMPAHYTIKSLPIPNDDRIILRNLQKQRFITLRFSGRATSENITTHEQELIRYIKANDIQTSGEVQYALYDPPWTPAFWRRNEIMFALKGG